MCGGRRRVRAEEHSAAARFARVRLSGVSADGWMMGGCYVGIGGPGLDGRIVGRPGFSFCSGPLRSTVVPGDALRGPHLLRAHRRPAARGDAGERAAPGCYAGAPRPARRPPEAG